MAFPSLFIAEPQIFFFVFFDSDSLSNTTNLSWTNYTWDPDTQLITYYPKKPIPNTKTADSPSVVLYNNKIFLFHTGNEKNLWYNTYYNGNWIGDKFLYLPNSFRIKNGPCAIVYKNILYVFFTVQDKVGRAHV